MPGNAPAPGPDQARHRTIRIDIDSRQVERALQALAEAAGDPSPAMAVIGEYLVASTRDRFAAGRAPDGTPLIDAAAQQARSPAGAGQTASSIDMVFIG